MPLPLAGRIACALDGQVIRADAENFFQRPPININFFTMNVEKIIKDAIDLHVHIGPEIISRKFTLAELIEAEKGKIGGLAVKNHFFPVGFSAGKNNDFIISSITLNNSIGGFNAAVVAAAADMSTKPIIVWFPTINAQNFLAKSEYEIPLEWLGANNKIKIKKAQDICGLSVLNNNGKIKNEVVEVLEVIKEKSAILATGHISWQETVVLATFAICQLKIKKVIVTHPIYQKINMPLEVQKKLANLGAYIEQCYSMYSIDKIPIEKIANQIRFIGADRSVISSDVGQKFSPNPSEALADFARLLFKAGINPKELMKMLVINPNKLIAQVAHENT
jgi:hypothetical protein